MGAEGASGNSLWPRGGAVEAVGMGTAGFAVISLGITACFLRPLTVCRGQTLARSPRAPAAAVPDHRMFASTWGHFNFHS